MRVVSPKRARDIAKRLTKAADLFGEGVGITKLLKDAARALEGLAGSVPAESAYLVWSNEHRAWRKPEERGYTRIIERAGRYTRAEAFAIARKHGGGWQIEANPHGDFLSRVSIRRSGDGQIEPNPPEIALPEADAIAQYAGVAA
ncbi:hypothetical protein [uncultured Sphingomonas sp.]|uniref:hypothetical protein n=1 Tax=uncultured Sphingomonas sp. TaxID=158754 RepID=UPI003748037A